MLEDAGFEPFSEPEHKLFLQGLEKFGTAQDGSAFSSIAAGIENRDETEVKLHAARYFASIQAVGPRETIESVRKEFDDDGRLRPSDFRERVVDVMEEHLKFTKILREHADFLVVSTRQAQGLCGSRPALESSQVKASW